MVLRLPNSQPRQYTTSRQMIAGDDFNNLVGQLNSQESGITASTVQTQAGAKQLGSHVNLISTVANANDAVKLPKGFPGLVVWIQNRAAANSAQVYTYGVGTINNVDGAVTGVALAASKTGATMYKCLDVDSTGAETWVSK